MVALNEGAARAAVAEFLWSVAVDLRPGKLDKNKVLANLIVETMEAGRPLNPYLRERAIALLRRGPSATPGKHRNGPRTAMRDVQIVCAILIAQKHGLARTRNGATKIRHSACSIVAEELSRIGIHLSEPAIEKIWEHHDFKAMPIQGPTITP